MSCSQLVEIEDLVLGTMADERARQLRAHVAGCTACRIEEARTMRELALFAERPTEAPSAMVDQVLRARLSAEVARPRAPGRARLVTARRGAGQAARGAWTALGRLTRRGHASAAAAALLFSMVALSRLGGAPTFEAERAVAIAVEPAGELCAMGVMYSGGARVSRAQLASPAERTTGEVLACLDPASGGTCDVPVTCSPLRQ